MAEAFTDDERAVLREAQERGLLSTSQQQAIVRREESVTRDVRPPVIEPIEPSKPTSLEELTGGLAGPGTFVGLGAVVGTAAGLAGGPAAPLTAIAGGALGAAGGRAVFETVEEAFRAMGFIEKPQLSRIGLVENIATEAVVDLAFAGVGAAVRPIFGARRIFAKMFGVLQPEAQQLTATAQRLGIGLGAVDVGGGIPKTFAKAVSVFPFTGGTGLRRRAATKQGEALKALDNILNQLAPNSMMTGALGINMGIAARNTTKEFKQVAGLLYDNFRGLAAKASTKEIIPTVNVRKVVGELTEEIEKGRIFLTTGEELPASVTDDVSKWVRQVNGLPENITIGQYQRLTNDLKNIMGKMGALGTDVRKATIIKDALEIDLSNIRTDLLKPAEGRALRESLDIANAFYAKGTVEFQTSAGRILLKTKLPEGFRGKIELETPTAKKFVQADLNIFGPGRVRPGTLNEDEIARVAVNLRSARAIDDLQGLVGRPVLRRAARLRVETAVDQATEEITVGTDTFKALNPKRFLSVLGIGSADKGQREALQALLGKGGVKLRDLEDLAKVVSKIEGIGDTSTFVKRRVILGGAAGGLTAATGFGGAALGGGAAAAPAALIPVLTLTALARRGSTIISSPQQLRNMITALDEARATTARRAALARLLRFVTRDDEKERSAVRTQPQALPAQNL